MIEEHEIIGKLCNKQKTESRAIRAEMITISDLKYHIWKIIYKIICRFIFSNWSLLYGCAKRLIDHLELEKFYI